MPRNKSKDNESKLRPVSRSGRRKDASGCEIRGDWAGIRDAYVEDGLSLAQIKGQFDVSMAQCRLKAEVCDWDSQREAWLKESEEERGRDAERERDIEIYGASRLNHKLEQANKELKAALEVAKARQEQLAKPSRAKARERLKRLANELLSEDNAEAGAALNRLMHEKAIESLALADLKVPKTWAEAKVCLEVARQALKMGNDDHNRNALININLLSNSEANGPQPKAVEVEPREVETREVEAELLS